MALGSQPKVLLFDIGGVCVTSPFKAILEYEARHNIPRGYINYSIRKLTPNGSWHQLERGEVKLDKTFFQSFKSDIQRQDSWTDFHREKLGISDRSQIPPPPDVDAEELYWTMMSTARTPDPYMFPALRKLKASRKFHLAAMSNTSIFPEGHPYSEVGPDDHRQFFDVFVSSAHVGMRKPNRDIYEYTLQKVREKWGQDIQPSDIVFLDDIGENLRMGRIVGFRTIKVLLGRSDEAVRELEKMTGVELLESKPRSKARL